MGYKRTIGNLDFRVVNFPIYGWKGDIHIIFISGHFASAHFMPDGVEICRAGGGWKFTLNETKGE